MKKYQWILFDADETLFRFDAFGGLQLMFSHLNIEFTQQDYDSYQEVNKVLWVDYQNGNITAEQLQQQRFDGWAAKLNVLPEFLNNQFLLAMAEICAPLEGALNLINALKPHYKLGIITNGFAKLQQIRLERMGLKEHFDFVVISEQVGIAKPHPAIFEHAFALMRHPERDQILMVGDNPESDILGGLNVGIDTCWFNAESKPEPEGIKPHYQVASLEELECKLLSFLQ